MQGPFITVGHLSNVINAQMSLRGRTLLLAVNIRRDDLVRRTSRCSSNTRSTMLSYVLHALAASLPIVTTYAAPPCTSARPQAICLEYMNPYSDNAYFWTSVIGASNTPADQSVLTAMNGEFYSSIYGW